MKRPDCAVAALVPRVCIAVALLCCLNSAAQEGLPYTVSFEGVSDEALLQALREQSEAETMRDQRPASVLHLRRRAQRDVETFNRLLRSRAHYASEVDFRVDRDAEPALLVYEVTAGPQYMFNTIDIRAAAEDELLPLPPPAEIGLEAGQPGVTQSILDAETKMVDLLRNSGYPLASMADRKVIVNHATQSVNVSLTVAAGPRARFGPVNITGLEHVRERVVLREAPWETGDEFRLGLLEEYQSRLYETELFSLVRVTHGDEVAEDGSIPVNVEVTVGPPRTIAAGAEYHSDEGASVRVMWEHRNLAGLGNAFNAELRLGSTAYSLDLEYRIRRFKRDDQSLVTRIELGDFEYDAFDSRRLGASTFIEREFSEHFTGTLGVKARYEQTEQLGVEEEFTLFSVPLQGIWDYSDDLLDPTQGYRITSRTEPFKELGGHGALFLKSEFLFTHYLRLTDTPDWVLASRLHLGFITGDELEHIPPSDRFYSGGGGSIRGYPYQTVGPLIDDDPIGGRSVSELSLELRRRITETIGMVAFVDAGAAYEKSFPALGDDVRVGAGLGVRYFTPIGPIRADVAVPLNPRDDIDDSFQFYISIGQAF